MGRAQRFGLAPVHALVAILTLCACAHAQGEDRAAAALGDDQEFGDADMYSSATDDVRLPEDEPGDADADNPYAEQYGHLDAAEVLEGWAVLYTPEPTQPTPPGAADERYGAVSPELPAGTVARVTRLDDGRSVVVQVRRRERLPRGTIALSEQAGRRLGLMDRAELPARVEVLASPEARVR